MLHKKIPNKCLVFLLGLLPFFYGYLFLTHQIMGWVLIFSFQIVVSILLSFLLYYYGVWSAGDAKYLLLLSLYLPNMGIVSFIGNLALITITYLFGYYIYFYGKLLFRGKVYQNSFLVNVYKDQKDRIIFLLNHHKISNNGTKKAVLGLLKFILIFFIFFVSIRLIRSYLMEDIRDLGTVHAYIIQYPAYAIFILWGFFFLAFYFLKKTLIKIKAWIQKILTAYGYSTNVDTVFILILFSLLLWFITYRYSINPKEISHKLFLVFTLYLILFFIFRSLFYSYRIVFQLGEQDIIPISKLQQGDMVEREYLIKLFWSQKSLWFWEKKGLLSPSPLEYFQNVENPIDHETFIKLKKVYSTVNRYHKKNKTPGFEMIQTIKVLRTFSFGLYIFVGFIITFLWWELPTQIVIKDILYIIHLLF